VQKGISRTGRFSLVNYKNGEVILPPELLERLQEYVQGEIVYIPKREKQRTGWGVNCGTKQLITKRNYEIFNLYEKGIKIPDIALEFYLAEDSIRKIIRAMRNIEKISINCI
jgi:Mor family transcriptional regulator